MAYTIAEHQHRLAAWEASTSARASCLCRFTVKKGVALLEAAGFGPQLAAPEQLPLPQALDEAHKAWRGRVVAEAAKRDLTFTHGVAAKLVNSYLKARFVCAGHHEHERVKCLHPPVDALLLSGLCQADVGGFRSEWRRLHEARWSRFDSSQYEEVIRLIRRSIPGRPLWEIEQHWRGYQ